MEKITFKKLKNKKNNMIKKFIIIIIFSSVPYPLFALIGSCCRYGHDPKSPSPYNYQLRYFVECYCNCTATTGQCPECGHSHAPKDKQVVVTSQTNLVKKSKNLNNLPTTINNALKQLILRYKTALH